MYLIVAPQLGGGRRHNYSTKTRQAGQANEQYMYSLMSMCITYDCHFDASRGLYDRNMFIAEATEAFTFLLKTFFCKQINFLLGPEL